MFSCEFCGISENNFFTEHLWTTASALSDYYFADLPRPSRDDLNNIGNNDDGTLLPPPPPSPLY